MWKVAAPETSEPEPDVIVVRGQLGDYMRSHPRTAELVVEVAGLNGTLFRDGPRQSVAKGTAKDTALLKLGKKYGAIFTGHAALIEDPELVKEIERLIREENHSAEYALSMVMRRHAKALESLNNPLFSTERTAS